MIYVLDGSSQDQHIADTFYSLSALGLVPQTIVVGIPNISQRPNTSVGAALHAYNNPAKRRARPEPGIHFCHSWKRSLFRLWQRNTVPRVCGLLRATREAVCCALFADLQAGSVRGPFLFQHAYVAAGQFAGFASSRIPVLEENYQYFLNTLALA